jgi:hypothetical protein
MIAQVGIRQFKPPRYAALEECLGKVAAYAMEKRIVSVYMPRIGCGLAGGTWDCVEPILERTLCGSGVVVVVYDLE